MKKVLELTGTAGQVANALAWIAATNKGMTLYEYAKRTCLEIIVDRQVTEISKELKNG